MSSQAGSIRHSLVTSIDRSCSYRKVSGQNMFAAQPGRLSLPIKSPCTEWPVSNKFPHLYTPQRWWTDCSWASRRQTRMYTLASAGTDTEHPLPSWETAPRSMTCCASAFPPSFLSLWRKAEWTDVITWQLIDFPNQINCRVKPGNQETAWYLIFKLEALHVVHVSVAVMKVTLQGCSWHFLCCPRLHCRILIKPIAVVPSGGSTERSGNDWLWLVMTGCDWIWLAMTGCDWIWLVVTGCDWIWLDVTGCNWIWLIVTGTSIPSTNHDEPWGSHGPRQTQQKSALQLWFLHTMWLQPPSFSMVTWHLGHSCVKQEPVWRACCHGFEGSVQCTMPLTIIPWCWQQSSLRFRCHHRISWSTSSANSIWQDRATVHHNQNYGFRKQIIEITS